MVNDMEKTSFRPGNMLYPAPAVLVSCSDGEGHANMLTLAWAGTVCSDPPMLSVSIRKERFSHHMIMKTGEFVVNLTTEELVRAADFSGVRSGKDTDKWKETGLTMGKAFKVNAPVIAESPVNIECRVKKVLELGSHDMFIAEVVAVGVDKRLLDEKGRLRLEDCGLIAYVHGAYQALGKKLGTFGFSVKKERAKEKDKRAAAGRKKTAGQAPKKKTNAKADGKKKQ